MFFSKHSWVFISTHRLVLSPTGECSSPIYGCLSQHTSGCSFPKVWTKEEKGDEKKEEDEKEEDAKEEDEKDEYEKEEDEKEEDEKEEKGHMGRVGPWYAIT